MEDKSHAVIAVTFLIVFILGAVAIFMWLHRGPSEDRYYDIVSSYTVGGLQPEAPVDFKGLRVGNVKRIFFDPHNPDKVIVRIAVFKNAYVTHATYAKLGSKGITGLSYIILANRSGPSKTPLTTNAQHPARIPMRRGLLSSLEHTGTATLDRINSIAGRVDSLLNAHNRQHVTEILKQLDQATRQLTVLERQLAPAVKTMPQLSAQTGKLLHSSRQLALTMQRLARHANGPVKNLGDTARSVTQLSQTSTKLVDRVNNSLLPRMNTLLQRMNQTIVRIDQLTRQLNAQPQSLVFGKSSRPPGPGEPGFHPPAPKQ